MGKTVAKNAIILINGYALSPLITAFSVDGNVNPVKVTGFTDGSENFIPGALSASMKLDCLWDSTTNSIHDVLKAVTANGVCTLLPEGYVLGYPTISLPFMQVNYAPQGTPTSELKVGSIDLQSYGSNVGLEAGVALTHGTITATTSSTGVLDPTGASVTAACGATLHCWGTPLPTDRYVIVVEHSTAVSTGYTTLITFVADGSLRTVERQTVASGTIKKYRRVTATRTGTAGDSFGFSVHFYHL
jgi:hypothetical protein